MSNKESKLRQLKDELVIIGIGETDYPSIYQKAKEKTKPDYDAYGLLATAFKRALNDAGLEKDHIDGIGISEVSSIERVCEILGLNPRWTFAPVDYSSASSALLMQSSMALYSGVAEYIVLLQGNNQRSAGIQYGGPSAMGGEKHLSFVYWSPWGFTSQGAIYALMTQRYMTLFNTTERELGSVAVTERSNASLNPNAIMKQSLTIEEYLASNYLAAPLRLYDYCLVNDGGTALIVTTSDNARKYKKPPVYLSGFGVGTDANEPTTMRPRMKFYGDSVRLANEQAFSMAGVNRGDIDSLQIYDAFSCQVLFGIESLGYCQPGKASEFISQGHGPVFSPLPINTSGGHLSESYMRGWNHQIEIVKQLRGECGERQIQRARRIQYLVDAGGIAHTLIYRRD